MYAYFLYEIDKLSTADINRRAEIHRMVREARRERRADRQPSAHTLRRLLPTALTGSRR
jgi:hypothetical protein